MKRSVRHKEAASVRRERPKRAFVKGEHVHPDWDAQTVEAKYDDVYDVSKVDYKDFGGEMAHWEVGGV